MLGLHSQGELVAARYQIVTRLGQGSMGTTYAAVDVHTSQRVAMKVVSLRQATEWKVLDLFAREAQVLETLQHPGIPRYIDYFDLDTPDDRRFYLIQELVEGSSLLALSETGWRPSETEAVAIAQQVLAILAYIHSLSPPVVHRDIKPENLIREANGRVVLVDFGAVQAAYRATLSRSATFVGTLGYMPPEQFRGQTVPASDLYSLGATLVYLLSGQSPADLPQQRLKLDFRPEVAVSPAFADWLEQLLEPALEDRFPSATAAQAALVDLAALPGTPRLTTSRPRNSSVQLVRRPQQLQVKIPSGTWWQGGRLALLISNWLWNLLALPAIAFLGLAMGFVFRDETLGVALGVALILGIPILFLGCGSWVLWKFLRLLKGDRVTLTVTPQRAELHYQFWPLQVTLRAATQDVELRLTPDQQFLEWHCSAIWEPTRRSQWGWAQRLTRPLSYRFGSALTVAERTWLHSEIQHFLATQQPPNAQPGQKVQRPHSRIQVATAADILRLEVLANRSSLVLPSLVLVGGLLAWWFWPLVLVILVATATYKPQLLWTLIGQLELRFDREDFLLTWFYLGYRYEVRGKTASLQRAEFREAFKDFRDRPVSTCALVLEQEAVLFGTWLRSHEKALLLEEINQYLQAQQRKPAAGEEESQSSKSDD